MTFYSYNYVLSRINQQNWITVTISALLLLVTGFLPLKLIATNGIQNSVNW